jgi:redox-sensitive bicupin YhaK (pirin superfamily)
MGNGSADGAHAGVIRPGDVQRMSAGTGVLHSEFNHAGDRTTHFLQIWLLPRRRGVEPDYEQKHFDASRRRGRLLPIVTPQGQDGSLRINADASIAAGLFDGDEAATVALDPARLAYVHVARGAIEVNGQRLQAGDAAMLDGETQLQLRHGEGAEVLVFDLARL